MSGVKLVGLNDLRMYFYLINKLLIIKNERLKTLGKLFAFYFSNKTSKMLKAKKKTDIRMLSHTMQTKTSLGEQTFL